MIDGDGRPLHLRWEYDRREIIADGVVHAVGLLFAIAGGIAIVVLASLYAGGTVTAAVAVYASGLISLLAVSAAYNLWPVSPVKWRLRRVDHALIFVLIAATYTPFVTRMNGAAAAVLLALVWSVAISGAALKLLYPGRFDRFSIVLCLLLGGTGALFYDTVSAALPASTIALMISGAAVYSAGVVFHVWDGLPFQNAVWHSFVLVASVLFYSAVLDGVVFA